MSIAKRREPSTLRLAQMRNSPAPHDYDVVGAMRQLRRPPGGNFGKGAARFKGADKVALLGLADPVERLQRLVEHLDQLAE